MFKYKGGNFQSEIPKLYSEYKTSIPGFWQYHIKLVGQQKLAIETSEIKKECLSTSRGAVAGCSINVYAMKDMPAFIEEDYMTTKRNYLSRVEYELKTFNAPDGTKQHYTKTWKDADKDFKDNAVFASPDNGVHINFSTNVVGNKVNIILRYNLNSTMYLSDYYTSLKAYFGKVCRHTKQLNHSSKEKIIKLFSYFWNI